MERALAEHGFKSAEDMAAATPERGARDRSGHSPAAD